MEECSPYIACVSKVAFVVAGICAYTIDHLIPLTNILSLWVHHGCREPTIVLETKQQTPEMCNHFYGQK